MHVKLSEQHNADYPLEKADHHCLHIKTIYPRYDAASCAIDLMWSTVCMVRIGLFSQSIKFNKSNDILNQHKTTDNCESSDCTSAW